MDYPDAYKLLATVREAVRNGDREAIEPETARLRRACVRLRTVVAPNIAFHLAHLGCVRYATYRFIRARHNAHVRNLKPMWKGGG